NYLKEQTLCKIKVKIYSVKQSNSSPIEMVTKVLEKDLEIAKNKKEKYMSLALKARQVLSDDDTSSSDSNDEEYAMAVRDFNKLRKIKRKIKDASSVVIQITSLVIAPKTLPVIKRH
ncbi:hypothetical protein Tco_0235024, partial [Tanacetum coccineum]